jgi:hypothetical protein
MKLRENKTFEGHIVFAYDQNNLSPSGNSNV